jgi:hypothetical protein
MRQSLEGVNKGISVGLDLSRGDANGFTGELQIHPLSSDPKTIALYPCTT